MVIILILQVSNNNNEDVLYKKNNVYIQKIIYKFYEDVLNDKKRIVATRRRTNKSL